MKEVVLGRSGLRVTRIGYDLSSLAGVSFAKSKELTDKVLDTGITFFDTGLPEEETLKRIGHALAGKRNTIVLAGSFPPVKPEVFADQLKMALRSLKTDYLDLCQIHDPDYLPRLHDHEGFYDALMDAKKAGYIRSVGITTGTPQIAMNALEFGWYDTLQYPWTMESLKDEEGVDLDFLTFAKEADVGSISVTMDLDEKDPEKLLEKIKQEVRYQGRFDQHAVLLPLLAPYTDPDLSLLIDEVKA